MKWQPWDCRQASESPGLPWGQVNKNICLSHIPWPQYIWQPAIQLTASNTSDSQQYISQQCIHQSAIHLRARHAPTNNTFDSHACASQQCMCKRAEYSVSVWLLTRGWTGMLNVCVPLVPRKTTSTVSMWVYGSHHDLCYDADCSRSSTCLSRSESFPHFAFWLHPSC